MVDGQLIRLLLPVNFSESILIVNSKLKKDELLARATLFGYLTAGMLINSFIELVKIFRYANLIEARCKVLDETKYC